MRFQRDCLPPLFYGGGFLNTALALAVTVTLFASTLDAQTRPGQTTGIPVQSTATEAPRGLLAPVLRSPEVHPDRTVTFRLRAPLATTVELVGEVLLEQTIPMIENNFRVYKDADHRAIGGLSMGAFQSIPIGLAHPELFHYVLAYSGGFGGIGPAIQGDIETQSPWKELLANPEQTRKNLRLLFLGAGQQETAMLNPGKRLVKLFKESGINAVWADYPGGHVFSVWRNHLKYTAPMLLRSQSLSQ